jgi:hypothetical protein
VRNDKNARKGHGMDKKSCNERYKPLIDKLFWLLFLPTNAFLLAVLLPLTIPLPKMWIFTAVTLIFCDYFFISPLFGFVELREETLFIKYGFILKKEIPYRKIRALQKERKCISHSFMALKLAMDHVNIKYNAFDVTTVSVISNDEFSTALNERIKKAKEN